MAVYCQRLCLPAGVRCHWRKGPFREQHNPGKAKRPASCKVGLRSFAAAKPLSRNGIALVDLLYWTISILQYMHFVPNALCTSCIPTRISSLQFSPLWSLWELLGSFAGGIIENRFRPLKRHRTFQHLDILGFPTTLRLASR